MGKTGRQDVHVHGCPGPGMLLEKSLADHASQRTWMYSCSHFFPGDRLCPKLLKPPDARNLYVSVVSLFCPYASRVTEDSTRHGPLAIITSALAHVPSIRRQLIFSPRV